MGKKAEEKLYKLLYLKFVKVAGDDIVALKKNDIPLGLHCHSVKEGALLAVLRPQLE